jgi:hypothetical protein
VHELETVQQPQLYREQQDGEKGDQDEHGSARQCYNARLPSFASYFPRTDTTPAVDANAFGNRRPD